MDPSLHVWDAEDPAAMQFVGVAMGIVLLANWWFIRRIRRRRHQQ